MCTHKYHMCIYIGIHTHTHTHTHTHMHTHPHAHRQTYTQKDRQADIHSLTQPFLATQLYICSHK